MSNERKLQANVKKTRIKNRSQNRSKNRIHQKNLGAAAVEFAVVAPLLVMLTFGMIEISRVVMVKQLLINASREGARLAVLPTANEQQVISQVQSELASALISGATISLSPQSLSLAPAGTPVTVSIQVNATSVSWLPKPMFVISQTISAATTMRRESL